MKEILKYGSLIILALLLVACGPSAEEVASTYVAQTAAAATDTPVPTATNTSTLTPSPTMTPTIEPQSQLSDLLQNPRFTFYDSFDFIDTEIWKVQPCQTVSNGELEYACTDSFTSRNHAFHEGEGILIDFKTVEQNNDIWWVINLETGTYDEDDWRYFGVASSQWSQSGYQTVIVKRHDHLDFDISWLKPNVWYRLALAIGENGQILVASWERDNPEAQPWYYTNTLGEDWANLEWTFSIGNNDTVLLYFDNFYMIEFDSIN